MYPQYPPAPISKHWSIPGRQGVPTQHQILMLYPPVEPPSQNSATSGGNVALTYYTQDCQSFPSSTPKSVDAHTSGTSQDNKNRRKREAMFVCPNCALILSASSSKERHKKLHASGRPYSCHNIICAFYTADDPEHAVKDTIDATVISGLVDIPS